MAVRHGLGKMDKDEELRQERQALRLLCSNLVRAATRVELCNLLDSSLFQDTLHRVAFEEIRTAGAAPGKRRLRGVSGRRSQRGLSGFCVVGFLRKRLG